MKSNFDDELTLDKIDDYNGNESKEKRNTVRVVVVAILVVGAVFAYMKYNSSFDDYVGTQEAPGIVTTKK